MSTPFFAFLPAIVFMAVQFVLMFATVYAARLAIRHDAEQETPTERVAGNL